MNKRLSLIPITGLVLLNLAGCGATSNATGVNNNQATNSTTNTSQVGTVSNSTANTSGSSSTSNTITSGTQQQNPNTSNYANEVAFIKGKGYDVSGATPSASVRTASGDTLSAWIGVATKSDGHNQFVFFFLNGKYLGTDTAQPSAGITSAKVAGNGIAVTYPVYKKNDSFANPTGTPVTITYTWNGSKLVPDKPYPKQFS